MAIIRTASIVGAISGNLDSINFANSPHGPYVRRKFQRTKPTTARQVNHRTRYQRAHIAWNALTVAQRQGWTTLAAAYITHNRLGVQSHLTGWQLYLKFFVYCTHFVFSAPTTAPAMVTQPGPLTVVLDLQSGGGSECTVTRPASGDTITWELQISRTYSSNDRGPGRVWTFVDLDVNFSTAIDIDDELAAASPPLIADEVVWYRVRTGQPDVFPSPWLLGSVVTA